MNKLGSKGSLVIPLVLAILLFFGALGFGFWAFSGRQDYKNNADKKINSAVSVAKQQQLEADNATFAEEAKQPLKPYRGPDTYGSLNIMYPKTWSSFVTVTPGGTPIEGYFYPDYIPNLVNTSFALRVQVTATTYAQELQQFNGTVNTGRAKITPYTAAKVPGVLGSRVDGALANNKQGSMVLFPLRDKTLKIWTEAGQFKADFDKNILPNITFSP